MLGVRPAGERRCRRWKCGSACAWPCPRLSRSISARTAAPKQALAGGGRYQCGVSGCGPGDDSPPHRRLIRLLAVLLFLVGAGGGAALAARWIEPGAGWIPLFAIWAAALGGLVRLSARRATRARRPAACKLPASHAAPAGVPRADASIGPRRGRGRGRPGPAVARAELHDVAGVAVTGVSAIKDSELRARLLKRPPAGGGPRPIPALRKWGSPGMREARAGGPKPAVPAWARAGRAAGLVPALRSAREPRPELTRDGRVIPRPIRLRRSSRPAWQGRPANAGRRGAL